MSQGRCQSSWMAGWPRTRVKDPVHSNSVSCLAPPSNQTDVQRRHRNLPPRVQTAAAPNVLPGKAPAVNASLPVPLAMPDRGPTEPRPSSLYRPLGAGRQPPPRSAVELAACRIPPPGATAMPGNRIASPEPDSEPCSPSFPMRPVLGGLPGYPGTVRRTGRQPTLGPAIDVGLCGAGQCGP